VWFLCETRSPGYRVRHPSCEPCRFPCRPTKRERRTRSQHIEAPTVPTCSRPSKRPRLRCDRGLRGTQRSPHDRNTGSGLDPLCNSNSQPQVCGPFLPTLFPFGPFSVPGPNKVAFSQLLSRVARPDQPFPHAPFRVPPSYLPFRPCPCHHMYVELPHSFLPAQFYVATPTTPFLRPRGAVPGITCHLPLFVPP